MIIDFHTHVCTPEDAAKPYWQGRCPLTIENVLDAQKIAGVDMTVISNPLHELRGMDRAQQLEIVKKQNRIDLLPSAGGALRLRDGGCRSLHFRDRRAAAEVVEAAGRGRDKADAPVAGGRAKGLFGECQAAPEDLIRHAARFNFIVACEAITASMTIRTQTFLA
jgi:hypothetical protein